MVKIVFRSGWLKTAVFSFLVTFLIFFVEFLPPGANVFKFDDFMSPVDGSTHHEPFLDQIQNETLGFQETFMISLPSRTDKRDAFALGAALSEIKYTHLDGVNGEEITAKALPHVSLEPSAAFGELINVIDNGPKSDGPRLLACPS